MTIMRVSANESTNEVAAPAQAPATRASSGH